MLRSIGRKSVNNFTSEDVQKSKKWAKKFFAELGVKSPFFRAWFGDWRANDHSEINLIPVTSIRVEDALANMPVGTFSNKDVGWDISVGSLGKGDTYSHSGREKVSVRMLSEIKNILESAVLLDTEVSVKDSSKKYSETTFMHKLYAPVTYAGELYIAKVTVEEYGSAEHGKRFYNLRGIKIDPAGGAPDANASYDTVPDTGSIHSISDLFALVKKYDDSFKPHEPSKVVNADGKDGSNPDIRYSLVGETNDGIEVYETSEEVRALPFSERKNCSPKLCASSMQGGRQSLHATAMYIMLGLMIVIFRKMYMGTSVHRSVDIAPKSM